MGQLSGKTILAGVAGAVGVVATTQVPMVQGAMAQLAENAMPKTESVKQEPAKSLAGTKARQASSKFDAKVTTKADVVRQNAVAAQPASSPIVDIVEQALPTSEASSAVSSAPAVEHLVASVAPSQASSVASSVAPSTPAEQAVIAEETASVAKPANTIVYTIVDGDTLGKLALDYGVTVEAIVAANPGVDLGMLQIGQTIYIPATQTAGVETPVAQAPVTETEAPAASEAPVASETPVTSVAPESVAPTQPVESEPAAPAADATPEVSTPASETPQATEPAATTPASDASYENTTPVTGTLTADQRAAIVNTALKYANMDIPYVWGGKTPSGFDCSGLVSWVLQEAIGKSIPSYTVSQEAYVTTTDVSSVADVKAKAQPGDLMFWGGHGSSWHIAIYIGNGQYVVAPQPGEDVRVDTLSDYFVPDFIGTLN